MQRGKCTKLIQNNYFNTVKDLIPVHDEKEMCKHGNQYDHRDPKEQQWVECIDANLITTVDICIVSVYHRPSVGDCRCKKFYQGSHEFILNFTNETLVSHEKLFKVHCDLLLTHANFHGSMSLVTMHMTISLMNHVPHKKIWSAYRAFLGLLKMPIKDAYWCDKCEDADMIVLLCDGIQQGSSG